jgi:integrase
MSDTSTTRGRRGRKRRGTIEWHVDHWDVRPTLADGTRGARVCQPPDMTKARAQDKAQALTELAAQEGRVREVIDEAPKPAASGPTLASWLNQWGDDRERHGLLNVGGDLGTLRKWVLVRFEPPLGERDIRSITRDDIEALVEDLDTCVQGGELSWKTAINVWGLVSKAFDDAHNAKHRALRVVDVNPAAGVRGPERGTKKMKVYLYPSEFSRLVAFEEVPLRWRRIFAITTYLYLRASELRGLEWADFDPSWWR